MSNEKILGRALFDYAQDNDTLLPPLTSGRSTWRAAVHPMAQKKPAYKCPDDTCGIAPDGYATSYALNVGAVVSAPGTNPQPIAAAPNPNTLVLLCEIQNTEYAAFDVDDAVRFGPDKHTLAVRHSGGGNYLLADGHAKWFRPSAFTERMPNGPMHGFPPVRWHRDPRCALSVNARAVLADAQMRAR